MRALLICLTAIFTGLVAFPATAQQYQYDAAGRLVAALYPDGGSIRYEYDAASNITLVRYSPGVVALPPDGVIDTPEADVTIEVGQAVNFTGTGTDPDGATPLTFLWDFEGGAEDSIEEDPGDVTFDTVGTYTVTFTVSDATNLADPTPDTVVVTVTAGPDPLLPPNGVIDTPAADVSIQAGQSVTFSGTGTDPDGATPLSFAWNFGGGAANSTQEDPGDVIFANAGVYTVTFTVTDATSLSDPTPANVVVTVTAPPGGGGGGGPGGEDNGGGGSMFWLPLVAFAWLVVRRLRVPLLICTLLLSGIAGAQTATWQQMSSPTSETLNAVWGFSSSEVYAVGNRGAFLVYDGSVWRDYPGLVVPETVNLTAIWGRSPSDLYVGGTSSDPGQTTRLWHYDGASWAAVQIPDFPGLVDVWSPGPANPLYVISGLGGWQLDAGLDPRVPENWLRRGFVERTTGSLTPTAVLTAIGGAAGEVLMTGRQGGSATQPGAYRNFSRLTFFGTNMNDVYGFSGTEMVIVGDVSYVLNGNVRTFGDWSQIPTIRFAYGVWGSAPNDIYIVGAENSADGAIQRFDGATTEIVLRTPGIEFRDIHGFGPESAFAVGELGQIYALAPLEKLDTAANFPESGWLGGFVNAYTGELAFEQVDYSLAACLPIEFSRYYASGMTPRGLSGGSLGPNWRHNYDWHLLVEGDSVTVTTYQGRLLDFARGASGWTAVEPADADFALLDDVATGALVLLDRSTNLMRFFSPVDGRMSSVRDRLGNRLDLSYFSGTDRLSSVSDGQGQVLRFGYDLDKLVSVTTGVNASERSVSFGYTDGKLTSVTDGEGNQTRFIYGTEPGDARITAIQLPQGNVPYTWAYGNDDRVASQADVFGNTSTFGYDSGTSPASVSAPDGGLVQLRHDDQGRLVALTNGEGERTTFGYDGFGRVTQMTNPSGGTTSFDYDPVSGLLASTRGPGGEQQSTTFAVIDTVFGFDFHDASAVTNADGQTSRFEYGADGLRSAFVDAAGNRWTYRYDARGQIEAAGMPGGTEYTWVRDARCNVRALSDPNGNTTEYFYDGANRLATIIKPNGARVTMGYDANDRVVSRTNESGGSVALSFDANGNVATVSAATLGVVTYVYDDMGRPKEIHSPKGAITRVTYDSMGRVSDVTGPLGTRNTIGYDHADRARSMSLGGRAPWELRYDAAGIPDAFVMPDGRTFDFDTGGRADGGIAAYSDGPSTIRKTFDSNGRMTGYADGTGAILTRRSVNERGLLTGIEEFDGLLATGIEYNARGQPVRIVDPNGNGWSRDYQDSGRLVAMTDPLGRSSGFTYDELGLVETVSFPASLGTLTITRDVAGRESTRSYSDGLVLSYAYDVLGRLTSASGVDLGYDSSGNIEASNGISINYDAEDRIRTVELAPGRMVTYHYDDRGMLIRVDDWLGQAMSFDNDDAGYLREMARANGVTTALGYDSAGRLETIAEPGLASITITRNAKGFPVSSTRDVPQPAGIESASVRSYSYDAASQAEQFSHDALGRRTADDRRSYDWNLASRLNAYVEQGTSVSFDYDANGFRIARSDAGGTREFVWNYALALPSVSVEREAGQDSRYFVHTPAGDLLYSITPSGERHYYHFDEKGNTLYVSGDGGNVVAAYAYTPYGEVIAEQGALDNPFTYMGRQGAMREGDSDLYYVRARYYDAATGRFLSRDGDASVTPKRVNPYVYGRGNPVVFSDPTGMNPNEPWLTWIKRKASEFADDHPALTNAALGAANVLGTHWSGLAESAWQGLDTLSRNVAVVEGRHFQAADHYRRLEQAIANSPRFDLQHRQIVRNNLIYDMKRELTSARLNRQAATITRQALKSRAFWSAAKAVGATTFGAIVGAAIEDTAQYTRTDQGSYVAKSGVGALNLVISAAGKGGAGVAVGISTAVDAVFEPAFEKITGMDGVRLGAHEVLFTPVRMGAALIEDISQGHSPFAAGSSLNKAVDQLGRAENNSGVVSYFFATTGEQIDEYFGASDKLAELFVKMGW